MKTLYIECSMGAAGDMLMAALYELLEDQEGFLNTMNDMGLSGVRIEAADKVTCGIHGSKITVSIKGEEEEAAVALNGAQTESHCHEHAHTHGEGHDHEHAHTHGESHDHEHAHTRGESHDHEHTHTHGESHDHEHAHTHHHASQGDIAALIETLRLPQPVKEHAKAVYDAIARAEAKVHGCAIADVHYHEVGALDAVADVVGVCYALHLLAPQQIVVSPIHVGSGMIRCAHGILPVPAPATAELLTGIPAYGGTVEGELCTPTGAALLAHIATGFGSMPMMCVHKVGYGIGTKAFEQANCVRTFFGETQEEGKDTDRAANGKMMELVCNIDDMTPEALAFASSRLLEEGALDVYTVSGQMKKGRAGYVLTVLCAVEQKENMARQVLSLTTTNGLRVRDCDKYFLTSALEPVDTQWGSVRIKKSEGFGTVHVKPEYEDVAALARENHLPFQTVSKEAMAQYCVNSNRNT